MPIEREELEALFNSSSNNVEDERIKEYENRSAKASKDAEILDDLEQTISSQNLSSFLGDSAMSSKKKTDIVLPVVEETISLEDLIGSEDLNVEIDSSDSAEEDEKLQENVAIETESVVFDDDDDEITLEDLMGDDAPKADSKEEEIEEESAPEADPDIVNAIVRETLEKIPKTLVETKQDLKRSTEPEQKVEDISEEEIVEDKTDDEEFESVEDDKTVAEKYPNSFGSPPMRPGETADMSVVCYDQKYLSDPRYAEFYRQKLRAYNFLKINVPEIDYPKLRKEMEEAHVSVRMEGVISLDDFNEKIQQVQAVRNRLTKIRSICIHNYVPRKRIVRLLEDCLMKESQEKSNDKRAGEIQIHMAEMEYDLALSESFLKDIEQIMENITSAHEALSRQITVIQERNREIQRGQEPYIDSTQNEYDSILAEEKKKEESEASEEEIDDLTPMAPIDIRKKWQNIM